MATLPEVYGMLRKSIDHYESSDDDIKILETSLQNERVKFDEAVKKIQNDFSENLRLFSASLKSENEKFETIINNIKEEFPDGIQPGIGSIDDNFNDISSKLRHQKAIIEKAIKIIAKLSEESHPMLAASIYEKCQRLKDDIDLLESNILSQISSFTDMSFIHKYHGLRNKEKLNVLLVGEFSSGKTTFTRRLINDISGSVSGAPETACLVVHRGGDVQSICVEFHEKVQFDDMNISDKFEKFLRTFDLRTKFKIEDSKWYSLEKTFVEDRWGKEKILDFIKRTNDFPEAFSRITWTHIKAGRNKNVSTFLDFADIYDMPGIAGNLTHDQVIQDVFEQVKPDILLYLIDTAKGIPSNDEVSVLRILVEQIISSDISQAPDFYWVYQKPSNYSNDIENIELDDLSMDKNVEWIKEHKVILGNFIKLLHTGNDKIEPFKHKVLEYLNCTCIMDARGLVEDTERAQNAVALALLHYYFSRGSSYIKTAKEKLSMQPALPQILKSSVNNHHEVPDSCENKIIKDVLRKVKNSDDMTPDNFKRILRESLCVDKIILEQEPQCFPPDMYNSLKKWKEIIESTINIITDSALWQREQPKTFLSKIFSSDEGKPKEISLDFLSREFWEKYNTESDWQELVYLSQALNWIIESYTGNVIFHYINDVGNEILSNIDQEIKSFKKVGEASEYLGSIDLNIFIDNVEAEKASNGVSIT